MSFDNLLVKAQEDNKNRFVIGIIETDKYHNYSKDSDTQELKKKVNTLYINEFSVKEQLFTNNLFSIKEHTICKCSGKKDKNGTLIFENDIIEFYLPIKSLDGGFLYKNSPFKFNGVVLYDIGKCAFFVKVGEDTILFSSNWINSTPNIKVIGNIFDED